MRGRALSQDAKDALFIQLRAEGQPRWVIAKRCGIRHVDNVSHIARRLKLPLREYDKQPKRDLTEARKANKTRNDQRKTRSLGPLAEGPGEEAPTCYVCGGRSITWDGHDACTGRRGHTTCQREVA